MTFERNHKGTTVNKLVGNLAFVSSIRWHPSLPGHSQMRWNDDPKGTARFTAVRISEKQEKLKTFEKGQCPKLGARRLTKKIQRFILFNQNKISSIHDKRSADGMPN